MNRVIIDKKSKINIKNSIVIIDNETKIPLKSIDLLILYKDAEISLKEIAYISKNDTSILIITSKPKEFIFIQKKYIKNGDLKYLQYKALNKRLEIAKYILRKKIEKSYSNLIYFDLDIEKKKFLKDLDNVKNIEELLGVEGHLSKEYFKRFFSLFPKIVCKGYRSKNPPQDPLNALLSYVYTIFYYEISTWLNIYGFEPLIGYLHTPFREHMALSSDILEIFRADIDRFIYFLFLNKDITLKDFTKKGKEVFLTATGRKKLWTKLKPFMENQEIKIKEEIALLKKNLERN